MKGGVRKRSNKWYYYFDLGIVEGKRKKVERVGGNTKKEAEKALREALNEYENSGIVFEESNISLSDYLDFWYKEYVLLNCKYNTQESYRINIEKHIKPKLGAYKVKSLTPAILQNFINKKYKEDYSQNTLQVLKAILHRSLKSAVHPYKHIRENPMQYVSIPKTKSKTETNKVKTITLEEFNQILNIFPQDSFQRIVLLIGFHTGMRRGEIIALKWDNIDLDNKTITVKHTLIKKPNGMFELGQPKTESSCRTIFIGDTLIKALKEHKLYQKKMKLKYGEFYFDSDWVCTKENGQQVNTHTLDTIVRQIRVALNNDFHFHSLRHAHATLLLENGANIKDIQNRLGHSQLSTTMDTYSHVTDKMKNETVDIFEKITN
ncbi:site-specific integrase [Clostridioides difficile]|uniref:site-specific integrase n=1 Tax=Clostridioides difficile TaxID=1496 RepID=UPI0003B2A6D3|nr:site-specific integrase [Clostridioides difficile]AXU49813.1 prophage lambdaba04, site-specific recombinase [Clostridioides difficile]MBS4863815.1 site-specific integrase [Clostridioides difficile]MCU5999033.1 site-specific integrase [Clostridioides difficile]MCU6073282.1 site-specific integrase [Clostridioides difficile]MCV2267500.1 site-specific integrase [Clostridioides difficile]